MDTTPPIPPAAEPVKKRRFRLPTNVLLGLTFFGIAGSTVLYILPTKTHTGTVVTGGSPPFLLFLCSGIAMIILTAAFFAYIKRLGLGLSSTTLVLALGYNIAIVLIKFLIAPMAIYKVGAGSVLDAGNGDPNSALFYWLTGICIFLLYLLVFSILYKHYRKRVTTITLEPKRHTTLRLSLVLVILIAVLLVFGGGMLLFIPFLFVAPALKYLGYLTVMTVPIGAAIVVAILLAQRGFKEVSRQSIAVGNPALLATFFWIGLSLIMLYHLMWVVFMVTLVQLWPFNTYTPK
jgi:hypothetical protein